jgi:hypothetical protein
MVGDDPAREAYLVGDFPAALAGYRQSAMTRPKDDEGWAGLALATAKSGESGAAQMLAQRPELVRALLVDLGQEPDTGRRPAPEAVAAWLSAAVDCSQLQDRRAG